MLFQVSEDVLQIPDSLNLCEVGMDRQAWQVREM